MRRAELSKQSAKIVMDSRRLRHVSKGKQMRRSFGDMDEEEDEVVQMDPLPDSHEF